MHPVIMRQLAADHIKRCTRKQRMNAWPAGRAGPGVARRPRDQGFRPAGRPVTTIPAWTQASGRPCTSSPARRRCR